MKKNIIFWVINLIILQSTANPNKNNKYIFLQNLFYTNKQNTKQLIAKIFAQKNKDYDSLYTKIIFYDTTMTTIIHQTNNGIQISKNKVIVNTKKYIIDVLKIKLSEVEKVKYFYKITSFDSCKKQYDEESCLKNLYFVPVYEYKNKLHNTVFDIEFEGYKKSNKNCDCDCDEGLDYTYSYDADSNCIDIKP